jgi:hypothetical protein
MHAVKKARMQQAERKLSNGCLFSSYCVLGRKKKAEQLYADWWYSLLVVCWLWQEKSIEQRQAEARSCGAIPFHFFGGQRL